MIHQPLSRDRVHPPNQFVPEIVSPLPYSSGLVRHILLFVYLFQRIYLFHWLPRPMPHHCFQRLIFFCMSNNHSAVKHSVVNLLYIMDFMDP